MKRNEHPLSPPAARVEPVGCASGSAAGAVGASLSPEARAAGERRKAVVAAMLTIRGLMDRPEYRSADAVPLLAADGVDAAVAREALALINSELDEEAARQAEDKAKRITLKPKDYFGTATAFVDHAYTLDGTRLLVHHDKTYRRFTGTHYAEIAGDTVRAEMWRFLAESRVATEDGTRAYLPSTTSVNNTLDGVQALVNVPSTLRPPAWLAAASDDVCANELIAFRNALLHLPTGCVLPHTPRLFSIHCLPFDYDASAQAPQWLQFLHQLWDGDQQAIDSLQTAFGYILGGQTHLQKLFLIVGPKRSGKGTIARILNALLGPDAVCGPTLAGLAGPFGMQPLIGKTLAVISDARLSARADQATIAERLLTISGEDTVSVSRKFSEDWHGRLGVRFMLLTNELPRLTDASGALASRFIVWTLKKSFYGCEDHGLGNRLLGELPGVANWAIAGWRRLQSIGRIVPPASSEQAVAELDDLGSPVAAFLRERCEVGQHCEVSRERFYQAWREWCTAEGRDHPGTAESFGRDLRAALPALETKVHRADGRRERYHVGVGLAV